MANLIWSHESEAALIATYPPTAAFQNVSLEVVNHDPVAGLTENGVYKCLDVAGTFTWVQQGSQGAEEIVRGTFTEMLAETVADAFIVESDGGSNENEEGYWFRYNDAVGAGGWEKV